MRRVAWLAAWPAGVALGAASVLFAGSDPGYAFVDTGPTVALELLAGYALIACGLIAWRRGSSSRFGVVLAAAGCGWFLLQWNNPGVGSPLGFSTGLVLFMSAPPVVAHALLTHPAASLRPLERTVLAVAYTGSLLVLGLLPALVFDPAAQGCSECPRNLLLVSDSTSLHRGLSRLGVYLGLAWALLLLALVAWRAARSTAATRRVTSPVFAAGCLYLGLVAAEFAVSLQRGYISNDPLDRRLWLGEAAALVLLALAIIWSWLRARQTRARLARLVVELAEAPAPGRLELALAHSLGDPELRLAYPLADGRYVDAAGQPLEPGRSSTRLVRGGVEVALVTHAAGLLDDSGTVDALASTAPLALEHERLHAELLAQLADLRASRARIVTTGDVERRRLERDLHDGAQQRLVALTLDLRLARIRLEAQPEPNQMLSACVRRAEDELRTALAELRTLASGIFPAVLGDEGLAAAIEALAEEASGQLRITSLSEQRLEPAVESAAYRLISETLKQAGADPVTVRSFMTKGLLVLELECKSAPTELNELEDRLGALDGKLELDDAANGGSRIRAEIPCAS